MTAVLQLRALIANDLCRIDYLAAQVTGEDDPILPLTEAERTAIANRLGDLIRRVQRRRAALETLTRPTSSVADAHAPNGAQAADLSLSHV